MTIPRHKLTEYKCARAIQLTNAERDALRRCHPTLRIEPTAGTSDRYDLTPDQRIGLIVLDTCCFEILPKIPMPSVAFMVSYACGLVRWKDLTAEFSKNADLVEIMAMLLARAVQTATQRGLLCGYRSEDEPVRAPRGRILFDEFVRRRFAKAPPIDVRHDVYTSDIVENRILLAALMRLRRYPLRSRESRQAITSALHHFGEVALVEYTYDIPRVQHTRLNAHYQPALEFALRVLQSSSIDLGSGGARGSAFLVDMNKVFETFVRTAVRDHLRVALRNLPNKVHDTWLDEGGRVELEPDLCLTIDDRVRWIADVKYKDRSASKEQNADLYQLLAYTVSLKLDAGTLIYASAEKVPGTQHVVKHANKTLKIVSLDLSAAPNKLLAQVRDLVGALDHHAP